MVFFAVYISLELNIFYVGCYGCLHDAALVRYLIINIAIGELVYCQA